MGCPKCGTQNGFSVTVCAVCATNLSLPSASDPLTAFGLSTQVAPGITVESSARSSGDFSLKNFPKVTPGLLLTIAVVLAGIGFVLVIGRVMAAENTARIAFMTAMRNGDWEAAADMIDLGGRSADFINERGLINILPNVDILELNLTMNRLPDNRYLFFPDYKVCRTSFNNYIIHDFNVYTTEGSRVFINDVELMYQYNHDYHGGYRAERIFTGLYTIRIEHPVFPVHTGEVYVNHWNASYSHYFEHEIDSSLEQELAQKTSDAFAALADMASGREPSINLPPQFFSGNLLQWTIGLSGGGTGCESITHTGNFTLLPTFFSSYEMIVNQINAEYEYVLVSRNSDGILERNTHTGFVEIWAEYLFRDNRWDLSGITLGYIDIEAYYIEPDYLSYPHMFNEVEWVLPNYYRNYLEAINQQDVSLITNATPEHHDFLAERVFGVNRNHFFNLQNIVLDLDTFRLWADDDYTYVSFNAMFHWYQEPRAGQSGNPRNNSNMQYVSMNYNHETGHWAVADTVVMRGGELGDNQHWLYG